jgi:nicotinate-nucleotide pyrophosphorylase (carboxylating)
VQVEVTTLDQLRQLLDAGAPDILLDTHEVAQTGVDLISVGALTHSAPILDIAMDLRPC